MNPANPKLTSERLRRRAIVYVRQSSLDQVRHHTEGQRRQYGLSEYAHSLGFSDVVVVDEDLGRSGAGTVDRPGFQRLVSEVLAGSVGAVFCLEASRLARNGRDWHHLLELCGLTGAVIVDPDGVYDPGLINDRLLLGLKGTMSEFELNLFRQRAQEAARQKARRGELRFLVPIGYVWPRGGRIEIDPDQRVQHLLRLVFEKMAELGSARQGLLWFREQKLDMPVKAPDGETVWKPLLYQALYGILTNPIYAGVYAFGRTQSRIEVVEGRAQKTDGHRRDRAEWAVLIRDHHPGYIAWEQYERNQAALAANSYMKSKMGPRLGRGGSALLSGLLRCRRCGQMLRIHYTQRSQQSRYHCPGAQVKTGTGACISLGSGAVDEAVAAEVLKLISGNAVEAAVEAIEQRRTQRDQQRKAMEMELEQARYEARLAARRYEAVDPDNRLVSAELEMRWDGALQKVALLDGKLASGAPSGAEELLPDRELLLSLAQDLPAVWNSAAADMRLKQRIVQILLREIVADVNQEATQIVLLLHWVGGRHSELHVAKRAARRGRSTHVEAIAVVRQMAGRFSDEQIAATLNRIALRTGDGNTWNQKRVAALRYRQQLPSHDPTRETLLTMDQAADRLGISATAVRRLLRRKILPGTQAIPWAPWEIRPEALDSEVVKRAVEAIRRRIPVLPAPVADGPGPLFQE
jgi:DNA invertase Pin-like site-specific DNA recombinase